MGIEALAGATTMPQLPTMPTVGGTDSTLGTDQTHAAGASTGGDFGNLLIKSLDSVEAMGDKASDLSVQAATGDLDAIHDYTIAATEAQVATQLTVAVRDKAVAAFTQIMQMSV
ncbi:flagellar hook-basal body complex protein FliE [Nocardioides sp. CER19]|uniref:flagellar hook-basal body complex protein FliE n=1 Tax=Nocardioides sp. CER19 TaxID=3038538 RepID=UPI00244C992E|nr:flagellar hook-basal body complex protein FliE [Nocardioides sp. CER19]MDH2414632.1 flagellar hook-basal body complex protein FliE [Nocardioides sp. CER19]